MALPAFNTEGDLPPGVHRVTMEEVLARFGSGGVARQRAASALKRIFEAAQGTGHLDRLIIFGSFVTAKPEPNDVDVIVVMDDGFRVENCDRAAAAIFDRQRAQHEIGASVFWIRPGLLISDTLPEFTKRWQRTRDGGQREIAEIMND